MNFIQEGSRPHYSADFDEDLVSGVTSDLVATDYVEASKNTSLDAGSFNCVGNGANSPNILTFSESGPEIGNKTSMMSSTSCNSTSDIDNDEYIYDYNESINMLPLEEMIPVAIVYGLTLVVGAIGNLLVIASIGRFRRMQSVTNVFLVSLASADLLLICACVPIKLTKFFTFTWTFGECLCKLVHYLQNISVICSVLTLTTMSLERYYAIVKPMRARYISTLSRAKRLVLLLWLASFCLALPIIKIQVHELVGDKYKGYWCLKEYMIVRSNVTPADDDAWYSSPLFWGKVYEVYMLLLILVVPLIAMSFAYVSICCELWSVMSSGSSANGERILTGSSVRRSNIKLQTTAASLMSGVSNDNALRVTPGDNGRRKPMKAVSYNVADDNSTRKQVIKMLVAIVVLFAICWSPSLVDNVLVAYGYANIYHIGAIRHLRQAFALLSYANSCVNPVVYAFMSKNFRTGFRKTLECGTRGACGRGGERARLDSQRIVRGGTGRYACERINTTTMMTISVMARQASTPLQMKPLCQQQTTCFIPSPGDIGGKASRTVAAVHQPILSDGASCRTGGNAYIHDSSLLNVNAKAESCSSTRSLLTTGVETPTMFTVSARSN